MLNITLASILIMLVSLVGVFTLWRQAGDFVQRNLSYLVSVSAGLFLVIVFSLASEAVHISDSATWGWLWVLVGAVGSWLLFKLLPGFHHHHDEYHEKEHTHSRLDARRILFGDALHNIGDGILLTAAFAVSVSFGWAAAVGILLHEFLQELSEFFVLKQAGNTTKQALLKNFLVSTTILIGALGSYFLINIFEALEPIFLGVSAGVFLVVVFQDLIPETVRHSISTKNYLGYILSFLLGVVLMVVINTALAGFHLHEHNHFDHNHEQDHDH